MNILVLSKKEAVKLSYKEFDRSVYAISIHSNYEYPARLHLQQSHVLSLCFDDIDGEYPTAISKEDADKIAGFVLNRIPGDARLLIVHCEAGQSRSAGVAAAIYIKSVGGQPWRGSLMAPFFVWVGNGWGLHKFFHPTSTQLQISAPTTCDIGRVIFSLKPIYNNSAKGSHAHCGSGGTLSEIWMRVHPTSKSVSHRYNSQQHLPSLSDCSCTCFQMVVLRRYVKAKTDKRQKTAGGSRAVECNPVACPLAR